MNKRDYDRQTAALLKANSIKPSHKKKATPAKKRTIGQDSQRARVSASGKVTKKPSARLMARRQKDTIPGYYPNPAKRKFDPMLQISVELMGAETTTGIRKQAHLSRADGMNDMAFLLGAITPAQQRHNLDRMLAMASRK